MLSLAPSLASLSLAAAESALKVVQLGLPDLHYEHAPSILKSDCLDMEVAIGVYEPRSHSGLMAASPQFAKKHLEQFKEAVTGLFENPSDLSVHVFGGAVLSPLGASKGLRARFKRFIIGERLHLEHALMTFFGANSLHFHWLPEGYAGRLALNTQTGKFEDLMWPALEPRI